MTLNFNVPHPKFLRYYQTMSVKLKKKAVTLPKIRNMFSPKKAPPRRSATLSSLYTVGLVSLTAKHLFALTPLFVCFFRLFFIRILFCSVLIFQLDRSAREFELGLDHGPPVLNINGQSWIFEDGQWMMRKYWAPFYSDIHQCHTSHEMIVPSESHGSSLELWRNFQRLKKQYEQVKEENNFLKLKYELLMEVVRAWFWHEPKKKIGQLISLREKTSIFVECFMVQ